MRTTVTRTIAVDSSSRPLMRTRTPALVALIAVVTWTALAFAFDGRYVLPYPWVLVQQLITDWGLLWSNAAVTLDVAAKGFVVGVLVILPLAVLCIAFSAFFISQLYFKSNWVLLSYRWNTKEWKRRIKARTK